MDRRGVAAGVAGIVAVIASIVAAAGDAPAAALIAGAGGAVAAALAVVLARAAGASSGVGAVDPSIPGEDEWPDHDTSLTDAETGLFSRAYFDAALDARVATARRVLRPLSIILLEVVERSGDRQQPAAIDPVVEAIRATLREADTACRVGGSRIGLILEDTPEDGAVWTAERLRRALATSEGGLTLWAGVASYPSHALGADELRTNAGHALQMATDWPQDRIEVAGEL